MPDFTVKTSHYSTRPLRIHAETLENAVNRAIAGLRQNYTNVEVTSLTPSTAEIHCAGTKIADRTADVTATYTIQEITNNHVHRSNRRRTRRPARPLAAS